jgi:hypothetical protein
MLDTEFISRITSRKFIVALLSLLSASLLVWFSKISDGVYSTIVVATVGAYLTANVFQSNIKTNKE